MEMTAQQLAALLNGVVEGDATAKVSRPAKIEEATEGTITFLANPKYEPYVYTTDASIVLVSRTFQPQKSIKPTLVRVEDVYSSVSFLLEQFNKANQNSFSTPSASKIVDDGAKNAAFIAASAQIAASASIGMFTYIGEKAVIGENVVIYPNVFVGNSVLIGEGSILYPGVRIMGDCVIGRNCIIQPNAVIGSDGFGFAPQQDGSYKKIPQIGNVLIGDNVEVGANAAIDRGTMGSTVIEDGVKLDNLVHIAHNVTVGKHTAMAAQVGIAGSTKIGEYNMIGGQTGIIGHIQTAPKTKIIARSGVMNPIEEADKTWCGSPIVEIRDFWRAQVHLKRMPDLTQQVKNLEKQLKQLQERINSLKEK